MYRADLYYVPEDRGGSQEIKGVRVQGSGGGIQVPGCENCE